LFQQHPERIAKEFLGKTEKLNAKTDDSPEETFGDAHLEWFRMSMVKVRNLPDHLVNKMMSTITERVVDSTAAEHE
jgi:hypothetical protein